MTRERGTDLLSLMKIRSKHHHPQLALAKPAHARALDPGESSSTSPDQGPCRFHESDRPVVPSEGCGPDKRWHVVKSDAKLSQP